MDCDDPAQVEGMFAHWREHGPPVVGPRDEFSLAVVTARWLELLR